MPAQAGTPCMCHCSRALSPDREHAHSCFTPTTGKFCGSMTRALVATGATSGLSLFFHALRFLSSSSPVVPPDSAPTSFLENPLEQLCPAEISGADSALAQGLHWPSVLVGILIGLLLIPLCEAILTARILLFRAALRRLGYSTRAPLYRLL